MSIKRTKPRVRGRSAETSSSQGLFGTSKNQKEVTWEEGVAACQDDEFTAYSMKVMFAKDALIAHPTFGKGIVLSVDDKKMEVLFKDGKKRLAMGMGQT